MIMYHIAMAISKAYSFRQFSLTFFRDIISLSSYVVKPTIVLIIGHFSIFCKICWNSAEKGKFCDSARNSATCKKLWQKDNFKINHNTQKVQQITRFKGPWTPKITIYFIHFPKTTSILW